MPYMNFLSILLSCFDCCYYAGRHSDDKGDNKHHPPLRTAFFLRSDSVPMPVQCTLAERQLAFQVLALTLQTVTRRVHHDGAAFFLYRCAGASRLSPILCLFRQVSQFRQTYLQLRFLLRYGLRPRLAQLAPEAVREYVPHVFLPSFARLSASPAARQEQDSHHDACNC